MRIVYEKLVRDRIPEIIEARGKACHTRILAADEFRQALRDKLVEEAEELRTAAGDTLVEELSDLYEILDALMLTYGMRREDVLVAQDNKRNERGGFQDRVWLEWVEEDAESHLDR